MAKTVWLILCCISGFAPNVVADYKDDVGYGELRTLLGSGIPTGAGVRVVQAEASAVEETDSNFPIYAPRVADFPGKTFLFPGSKPSTSVSGHATSVGGRFYGTGGFSNGITEIASYEAGDWLTGLHTDTAGSPFNASRIANHSWIATRDPNTDFGTVLRLVDRQVHVNEFIQVAAMNNRISDAPLLGSAFNVIAVGRTDAEHDFGSDPVDTVYGGGRTRPDLVVPQTTTSAATPLVASAAAVLVETGHKGGSNLSTGATTIDGVGIVYNAERSETVKAALMAGADRFTANTSSTANIADYRAAGHQTANGLDDRFGAGQLNILHSYEIIAGGEQNSLEDGGSPGGIRAAGFDYDNAFGGLASNLTATYQITALADLKLTASLVWNLGVANDSSLDTTWYDLDLELFDSSLNQQLAVSTSSVDNSEHIWIDLLAGHNYELRVKSAETNRFSWDYALAWHLVPLQAAPVPLPGAASLFLTAITALGFTFWRRT